MAPHGIYKCSRDLEDDADWAIACENEEDWRNLLSCLIWILSGWDLVVRQRFRSEIDLAITAWTLQLDKHDAAERLQRAGIPAGPVATAPDTLLKHKHQSVTFVPLSDCHASTRQSNTYGRLSSKEWSACPRLGAQSQRILQNWLGYTLSDTSFFGCRNNCRGASD